MANNADMPDVVPAPGNPNPMLGEKTDLAQVERAFSEDDIQKNHADHDRMDAEVAKYTTGERVYVDEHENKRLKKMIDKRVLSIMIVTYFLQAIDKGTISFASIMGIQEDLDMETDKNDRYTWLTTSIYIAIIFVEYPINWTIQRVPIGKFLGTSIMIWGTVLACHAASTNFTQILVCRILLGIFEAVCQPTNLLLSSMWFKREEQAATVTYCGAQQIVGGLLAYCFSLIPRGGALNSWQAIFVAYGAASVLWGLFVFIYLPDSPMRAKCFSEDDKRKMVERVRSNETGLQNKKWRKDQFIEVFKDPQVYGFCLIQICTTLPTSGLGAFANIIISGFGFSVLETQLLAMVLGAYIMAVLLGSNWLVTKYKQNLIICACFVIPSVVGTVVLMTVENTSTATSAGLLISYYLTLSFWAAQTMGMSLISRNVGGSTKKGFVMTINFCCWAAGNAVGPQVFRSEDNPRYFPAFATHMACYAVLFCALAFMRWHYIHSNNKKDRLAESGMNQAKDEAHTHAFDDLTDMQNPNFRYVY